MGSAFDAVALADWRRRVAELYADVRRTAPADPVGTAQRFRAGRDRLLRDHPQSPIAADRRAAWPGIAWHPYDPAWRLVGRVDRDVEPGEFEIMLADDGLLRCTRAARVRFTVQGVRAALTLYWINGYGGGLWLPFGDASNGRATYGGGRYLYDTIKGADLGGSEEAFVLDFNYAYNPSCAYDARWSCPLAPPENRLALAVVAGECSPDAHP